MAYVTLQEAKNHLRVDFDDDDLYINDLIDVAETSVSNEIEATLASVLVGGVLPLPLKQAILLIVGQFYNMREPVVVGTIVNKVPLSVDFLIAPYKTWVCK